MSQRNIERIVKKYGDIVRKEHPALPDSIYPHMFRRTRATDAGMEGCIVGAHIVLKQPVELRQRGDGIQVQQRKGSLKMMPRKNSGLEGKMSFEKCSG